MNIFRGNNIYISQSARIGKNVRIGDNSKIYDNVIIGDNSNICDGCVLGEPLNDYYHNESYVNPETVIGENSLIRSQTIIYAGNVIGHDFQTGHRVTIRECNSIGNHCSIGTLGDIQGYTKIGDYCRLHSNVHVGMKTELGNFVFVYPYVVFTNDPTPPSLEIVGSRIDDYAQIATGSLIMPGVSIGKHCLIGAGSIVSKNVEDYKLALGVPAKCVKDVRDVKDRITGESHYPWPYRFDRGMPWQEEGFDNWLNNNDINQTGGGKSLIFNLLCFTNKHGRVA